MSPQLNYCIFEDSTVVHLVKVQATAVWRGETWCGLHGELTDKQDGQGEEDCVPCWKEMLDNIPRTPERDLDPIDVEYARSFLDTAAEHDEGAAELRRMLGWTTD